jgi:ribosomal protein L16 Arg81 hydroxylase
MGGYQKMKFLEFTVHPGSILYVPPFWHYSIKFKEENQFVHVFNYGSLMNVVSNAFNLGNHYYEKFVNNRVLVKSAEAPKEAAESKQDTASHGIESKQESKPHSDTDLVKDGL